ncbi:carboxypeptidase-like regulatory domain-containing protein [Moheibacter stercoris]|uniref:5-hydroxyisourate hydrolase-like protein (Transthyretin family) n=1 Tax=Moheibacter stercoris TaxID=1628251 RepID=A0ABV2LR74_9FLAO
MKTKVLISAFVLMVSALFVLNHMKTNLSGKVQDFEGMGIMLSSLEIYSNDQEEKLIKSTMTNIDGSFEIKDLKPGEYKLVVNTPGFEKKVQTVKLDRLFKQDLGVIKIDGNVVTLPPVVIFG